MVNGRRKRWWSNFLNGMNHDSQARPVTVWSKRVICDMVRKRHAGRSRGRSGPLLLAFFFSVSPNIMEPPNRSVLAHLVHPGLHGQYAVVKTPSSSSAGKRKRSPELQGKYPTMMEREEYPGEAGMVTASGIPFEWTSRYSLKGHIQGDGFVGGPPNTKRRVEDKGTAGAVGEFIDMLPMYSD